MDVFDDLVAIVQYTRKDGSRGSWANMAAFDYRTIADQYAKKCAEGNPPWIYRVVDVKRNEGA